MTEEAAEPYLVFGQPFIDEETIADVGRTLRSRWIGAGPMVARFEREICEVVGARHAVAVASCTVGLEVALRVAGVGPGDEVVTSTLTFVATVNAILHAGAVPVLADVDPFTRVLDPAAVEKAITPRTRAVVPVHLAGLVAGVDEIAEIAACHDLRVVHDAAHALGAGADGGGIGSLGDLAVFSFGPPKNVTTGEGGMITTDDPELAAAAVTFCRQGLASGAWARLERGNLGTDLAVSDGQNYRMTDIAATIGLGGLRRLDADRRRREEIWGRYDEAFADLPLELPPAPPGTVHARQLYSPLVDVDQVGHDREWVRARLHERGVGTGVHYAPVHRHPYHRRLLGVSADDFPNADDIGARTFSLPASAHLSDADVERVVSAVRDVLG